MKQIPKNILILLSLLFFITFAQAQSKGGEKADIAIHVWQIAVEGDSLVIDLMIDAKDIHINTGQSIRLDIVIEDSLCRAFLPYVLFTGKQRLLFDQRSEIFAPDRNSSKPYHIFNGINPKKSYKLRYTFKVPHASWMDRASVYVKQIYHDCCDQWLVKNEVLTFGLSPCKTLPETQIEPALWAPDPAANNNVAVTCLISRDTESALTYINKLGNNHMGYNNRAVYYYMLGEMQQAEKYLRMALESKDTCKQAEKNLQLIAP